MKSNPEATFYYALVIEYYGKAYCGWQKQAHCTSVQGMLEQALSQIANQSIHTICAGRTDSGVHATGQVVSFATSTKRPLKAWQFAVNALLPADIKVIAVYDVDKDFNARFSALYRRYNYLIYQRETPSVLLLGHSTWLPYTLDVDVMNKACDYLLGEQDFSAFRSSQCQSQSTHRNIHHAFFKRNGNYIIFDIQANAFLHHMVRNIVGTLIEVGTGKQSPLWIESLLQQNDRKKAGKTSPAEGLYLVGVGYPEKYKVFENNLIWPSVSS